jgi:ketosteroid isomerase-like protein
MMKRLTVTLLTIALSAGMILAQPQTKAADAKKAAAVPNPAVDEIKQIENDWADASKAKDAAKLGDILADGWVALGWDGKTTTKTKVLADTKTPGNSLDTFEMGPMKVRIFGNTAVVTGSDTEKSMEDGKDTSGKYVWTDVFVKQNGKWRAVASQSTKLPSTTGS